jgi:hypothetical protein
VVPEDLGEDRVGEGEEDLGLEGRDVIEEGGEVHVAFAEGIVLRSVFEAVEGEGVDFGLGEEPRDEVHVVVAGGKVEGGTAVVVTRVDAGT